jgi:hypothetical protein
MLRFARALLPLALLAALGPSPASAGGPQSIDVAGEDGFGKGTLEDLSLSGDGVLRPGPAFDSLALDAPTAWAAVVSGDALWIGCGNDASLRRVTKDGKLETISLGDGLMVTALAPLPGGGVAAAVFPGGVIHRVSAAGKVEPLATIVADHVWALLADAKGQLTVASGVPGAVWSVDTAGQVTPVCDVDDDHARCLAGTADDLLVGTGGKGRVLGVKSGKTTVIRDLAHDEVVGIVRLADGSLLVAANNDAGGGNVMQLANLAKQIGAPTPVRGESKEPKERPTLQEGALLHLEASGAVTTLWEGKKTALLALVKDGDGAAAGTYPSGRIVRAAPGRSAALLADFPEAEASVLVADGAGLSAVVTSNPAVLHGRRAGASRGMYTTAPLDSGAVARWGRVTMAGRGAKRAAWRSGETSEPDATWTAWTPCAGFDGTSGTTGTTARFLQLQVALEGADAEMRSLSVVTEAPNRAPTLTVLSIDKPKGKDAGGPTSQREVSWKVEDADGDDLLTTVEVQRDGSTRWTALVKAEALAKPSTPWDTTGLPDGVYRVRVTVTDSPSNPAERARTAVLVSAPERVDNTAPRVTATARTTGDRLVVEGEASDQTGGQVRGVRVAIDGGPWQALPANDGLFDSASEGFRATLPSPGPGDHDVVVQALDADENPGATAVVVTLGPPR